MLDVYTLDGAPASAGGKGNVKRLLEPGREHARELAAAARLDDACADTPTVDDEQRGNRSDAEALDEVGALVGIDAHDLERVVVLEPLKHLGEKPVGAP